MRADELRSAVARISEVLDQADLRAAIDRLRAAKGDERTPAALELGEAGGIVAEGFAELSTAEMRVVKHLHLSSLGSTAYWDQLVETANVPGPANPEVVRLASRVMFASNHLPGLVRLLSETVSEAARPEPVEAPAIKPSLFEKRAPETPAATVTPSELTPSESTVVEHDGERLVARLIDAGERATDPDRIARSIDGIDMLYSACANIARAPAMNLRLDGMTGNDVRDLHFIGERDTVSAVTAVLNSIPDTIAGFDDSAELDLDEIVAALPIFADLQTLGTLGAFSAGELKEITETMYQGAMLSLESGITLAGASTPSPTVSAGASADSRKSGPLGGQQSKAAGDEEAAAYYDRYLKEREAMQLSSPSSMGASNRMRAPGSMDTLGETGLDSPAVATPADDAASRKDTVEELLKALGKGPNG